jgi:hypothetical protein
MIQRCFGGFYMRIIRLISNSMGQSPWEVKNISDSQKEISLLCVKREGSFPCSQDNA